MSRVRFLPFLFLFAILWVTLAHLHHLYLARYFGYHDVALINDFLASAFRQGRIFRVYDIGINHLSWLFTPSLFLVTPLYGIFRSQFLLLAWSTLAAFLGYGALLLAGDGLLKRTGASVGERTLGGLILATFMGLGPFPWRVATSGHFEPLFILGSGLTLLALVRGKGMLWLVPPAILALGTRQDAGLFLASQMIAIFFAPRWLRDFVPRRRLVALLLLSIAWIFVAVKFVPPAFGVNENWQAQRLWGHLGATYGQIAFHLLAHPILFWGEIRNSAFLELNRSVLFLPWLSPVGAFIVNAPGALFYTTLSPDRKQLLYYTSAMLLPGLFFATAVGLAQLRRWLRLRPFTLPTFAVLLLLAIFTSRFLDRIHDENRETPLEFADQIAFAREAIDSCPEVHSVASDFRTSVFLPNDVAKYLLWNYARADAVLYSSNGARFTPGAPPASVRAPDFPSFAVALAYLARDREYHLVGEGHGLLFLVRTGIACREITSEGPEEKW